MSIYLGMQSKLGEKFLSLQCKDKGGTGSRLDGFSSEKIAILNKISMILPSK